MEELLADFIQSYERVNKVNEDIIEKQKELIDLLQKHIIDLREIIEKHVFKNAEL